MVPDYDSILHATDSNAINRSEFYATGKELPDHGISMVERPYTVSNDENVVYGLIIMFLFLAAIFYHSKLIMAYRIKTFFTNKRVYSDTNVNDNHSAAIGTFILSCICACSQSLLVYHTLAREIIFPQYLDKPYWLIALLSLFFFLTIHLRAIVYSTTNWVFFEKEERKRWNNGYWLGISVLAYLFYTLNLISTFSNFSLKIVILCYSFIYILYEILLLYKLLVNFRIKNYGVLLIFLYFCTVEMLPLLLIWRFVEWGFNSDFVKNLLT